MAPSLSWALDSMMIVSPARKAAPLAGVVMRTAGRLLLPPTRVMLGVGGVLMPLPRKKPVWGG